MTILATSVVKEKNHDLPGGTGEGGGGVGILARHMENPTHGISDQSAGPDY